jgi:hypothetical protein
VEILYLSISALSPLWALDPLKIILYPQLVSTNLVYAFLLAQLFPFGTVLLLLLYAFVGRYTFTLTDFIHIYVCYP